MSSEKSSVGMSMCTWFEVDLKKIDEDRGYDAMGAALGDEVNGRQTLVAFSDMKRKYACGLLGPKIVDPRLEKHLIAAVDRVVEEANATRKELYKLASSCPHTPSWHHMHRFFIMLCARYITFFGSIWHRCEGPCGKCCYFLTLPWWL